VFQVGFGLSAFQSGMFMLGLFAGNLSMKPATTFMLRRFGFRNVLIWNGTLTAILMLGCSLLFASTPRTIILAVLFVNGLCRSMQFTCLSTLSFADVPKPDLSSATSFFSMITQMSMGMGVAVGAIALRAAGLLDGNAHGAPTTKEFHIAFFFVAALTLIGTIDCFALEPDAGAAVTGHRLSPMQQKPSAAS
jgi:MFS family permease